MNYSRSGWLRESPEVPHAKRGGWSLFHIHHYIDILQRDKVRQGACGQGQQLCRKKPLTMRFSADSQVYVRGLRVLLARHINAFLPQTAVVENISEHCVEMHITGTQITGINDVKNTEKRAEHANGV